jgi:anti-sigma factor RsiW
MTCDDLGPRLLDYLAGSLPDDEMAALRAHVTQCAACREELDHTAELWGELSAVAAPRPDSARMRARFDAALQGYIDGQSEPVARAALRPPSVWLQPWIQFAGAAAVLVLGVALGRFVIQPQSSNPEITLLRQELRDTRQMVTLSLLQQQSASERLKGVTWSSQIEAPGREVVSALVETLRHDPNVNVRLASVDALRRFGGRETVQRDVVAALPEQQSPLVQIALIDFLLEAQGPGAGPVLRQLAEDTMVDKTVRDRAARGLQQVGL